MLRRSLIALALTVLCTLVPTRPTVAQPPGSRDAVEARLRVLVVRLGLSPQQTSEVRVILTRAQAELEAMRAAARAAGVPPGVERQEERQRILWDAEDRIWALLSCTQKDAFRLLERERRAELLERVRPPDGHGPGHGPGRGHGGRRRMR